MERSPMYEALQAADVVQKPSDGTWEIHSAGGTKIVKKLRDFPSARRMLQEMVSTERTYPGQFGDNVSDARIGESQLFVQISEETRAFGSFNTRDDVEECKRTLKAWFLGEHL